MKRPTSTLSGLALDWAVAQALDYEVTTEGGYHEDLDCVVIYRLHGPSVPGRYAGDTEWAPHKRWDQGGPILDEYDIATVPLPDGLWRAYTPDGTRQVAQAGRWVQTFNWVHKQEGYGKLVAGLRCFVLSKLGSEVDVPEELLVTPLVREVTP